MNATTSDSKFKCITLLLGGGYNSIRNQTCDTYFSIFIRYITPHNIHDDSIGSMKRGISIVAWSGWCWRGSWLLAAVQTVGVGMHFDSSLSSSIWIRSPGLSLVCAQSQVLLTFANWGVDYPELSACCCVTMSTSRIGCHGHGVCDLRNLLLLLCTAFNGGKRYEIWRERKCFHARGNQVESSWISTRHSAYSILDAKHSYS